MIYDVFHALFTALYSFCQTSSFQLFRFLSQSVKTTSFFSDRFSCMALASDEYTALSYKFYV